MSYTPKDKTSFDIGFKGLNIAGLLITTESSIKDAKIVMNVDPEDVWGIFQQAVKEGKIVFEKPKSKKDVPPLNKIELVETKSYYLREGETLIAIEEDKAHKILSVYKDCLCGACGDKKLADYYVKSDNGSTTDSVCQDCYDRSYKKNKWKIIYDISAIQNFNLRDKIHFFEAVSKRLDKKVPITNRLHVDTMEVVVYVLEDMDEESSD